jgi:hypothetical protein
MGTAISTSGEGVADFCQCNTVRGGDAKGLRPGKQDRSIVQAWAASNGFHAAASNGEPGAATLPATPPLRSPNRAFTPAPQSMSSSTASSPGALRRSTVARSFSPQDFSNLQAAYQELAREQHALHTKAAAPGAVSLHLSAISTASSTQCPLGQDAHDRLQEADVSACYDAEDASCRASPGGAGKAA